MTILTYLFAGKLGCSMFFRAECCAGNAAAGHPDGVLSGWNDRGDS